mmetsp:Transcript_5172/g.11697  ORF Transcript_5172/g.11697 Transcript_5172/m.11697 type:complete len:202 (-) Transcript_5172:100-705(-)
MARHVRRAPPVALSLVAATLALSCAQTFIAGGGHFRARRRSMVQRAAEVAVSPGPGVAVPRKSSAGFSEVDLEQFYAASINGTGGFPSGIERDLITQHFGGGDVLGNGDHAAAFQALKDRMAQGDDFEGEDDGKGWIWLVADLPVSGLKLHLRKSIPIGKRPLLVAKQDNVDELFDKVDWKLARHRMNEVLGVRDFKGKKL